MTNVFGMSREECLDYFQKNWNNNRNSYEARKYRKQRKHEKSGKIWFNKNKSDEY